ncbi:MAG: hypothetical protein ACKPAD_11900, partial [Bacteroidota bacterium]
SLKKNTDLADETDFHGFDFRFQAIRLHPFNPLHQRSNKKDFQSNIVPHQHLTACDQSHT